MMTKKMSHHVSIFSCGSSLKQLSVAGTGAPAKRPTGGGVKPTSGMLAVTMVPTEPMGL